MSFVYPAGLWALLGVLVVVLACLIRQKHDMTGIASTYLWRLAQRIQKKSIAVQRLKRALLFVLQIFSVVLAALLIAQPRVLLPGAGTHHLAVIDGSGSMRIADAQGTTRFSRALDAAQRDAQKLPLGSSVTVVIAGDETSLLADHVSAGEVKDALERAQCGFGEGDFTGAAALCQAMYDEGRATQVCLYTDRDAAGGDNLRVVDLRGEGEWNVSVTSLAAQGSIYGTVFDAQVVSDGRSANVSFELYLDGKKQDEAKMELRVDGGVMEYGAVHCPAGESVTVSLLVRQVYDYADVRLVAVAQDGLAADNEYRLYAAPEKTTRALLVGERTFFLEKALSVFADVALEKAKTPRDAALEGYDLYVFDGCLPDDMPAQGAVWMINPPWTPKNTGIVFGEALMGAGISAVREFENEQLYAITEHLALKDASVVRFREVTSGGRFAPVLLCGRYPVLLAGRSDGGDAQLVMPFDLQDSNLPLLTDYVLLVRGMLNYSVPPMLERQDYASGAQVSPRTLERCRKLFLQTPDMRVRALDPQDGGMDLCLSAPGGYTLMQEMEDGQERLLSFFVHMPQKESRLEAQGGAAFALMTGKQTAEDVQPALAQPVALLRVLAAALVLVLLLEWVVYHREQY